ncbi:sugar phosphate isomerase/epimerase family protein [Streptacidiphilus fuscans]|uniref:Sugar phosphate isomerase/epimerase n=1 Tax=Streptacidiphilus fuscans TaxID=2789292 RepID=A0A931B3D3_9ACTN|nr:sugar phosphate isomerase/epimerase family protein [Streptacidiphilus fuscans]MBF9069506.1 sugar phosphate isomerase/epimerase [Streptacidiphilus fuscans]
MRLALSTLGLPGLPLADTVRLAADHGWEGLELRCTAGESVHLELDSAERLAARRLLERAGITPLCLASYVGVAAAGDDAPVVASLREHVRLAADLGAQSVRVFPSGGDDPLADADERAVRRLAVVADEAERAGVRVLVETHDSHRAARDVARVVARVDHPAVGGLWDLMHTWLAGESPSESWAALAPHLGHTQVKDIAGPDDLTPLALGAGVLPIAECVALLPPDGWVSWEYEAAWHPTAQPLPGLLGEGARYLSRARPGR